MPPADHVQRQIVTKIIVIKQADRGRGFHWWWLGL